MIVKIENWPIEKVIKYQAKIDPKPQYQRGNVWTTKDNILLIDSILKGYDIPKIYLRKSVPEDIYEYEVADGQQRLFAIWEFAKDDGFGIDKIELDSINYNNISYESLKTRSELSSVFQKFIKFKVTISILEEASDNEVRTLFARLQMGKRLNEAEKRNALGSAIGYAVDAVISTDPFFSNSKISDSRFNRQDFLAHVITLVHFQNSGDLKADLIRKMYESLYTNYPLSYIRNATKILKWMDKINENCGYRIKNKWAFVDFFWLLNRHFNKIQSINYELIANEFIEFERKRLMYSRRPEQLIETTDKNLYDKDLYEYIIAFNLSGSSTENIDTRARVFDKTYLKHITFKS